MGTTAMCITGATMLPAIAIVGLALVAGCGGEDEETGSSGAAIEHVHGLGPNRADGSLMIATHDGLFRQPAGGGAERVGESTQDTMGFTVVGPNTFLGSGHPGAGEAGPPLLGLIRSTDAGQTWEAVSLSGEADFHILRYAHDRVYGVDATSGRLMISEDLGESWEVRRPPPGVIDLVIDPRDPERMIASTQRGLLASEDGGRRWREVGAEIGLLAWPAIERLILVDAAGRVQLSADGGRSWRRVGAVGGQPAALEADGARRLYSVRVDGAVVESSDGGATWELRR